MNANSKSMPTFPEGEKGYLTVRVSTARGAIPLEGATVNVRGNREDDSGVIYSLLSDRDGKTPRVELNAPSSQNSASPGEALPYATYNIDVFKEGYSPVFFHSVPIFPGITSVQPAVMIPAVSEAINIDESYRATPDSKDAEKEELV